MNHFVSQVSGLWSAGLMVLEEYHKTRRAQMRRVKGVRRIEEDTEIHEGFLGCFAHAWVARIFKSFCEKMSKPVADINWVWIVGYSGIFLSFFVVFWHTYNGSESVGTDVRGKWLPLQTSNLQWVLTAVPTLKSLVLSLSFVFWYAIFNPPNSLSYAPTPLGCLFFACQFCGKSLKNHSGTNKSVVMNGRWHFRCFKWCPNPYEHEKFLWLRLIACNRDDVFIRTPLLPFWVCVDFSLPILCRRRDDSWSLSFIVRERIADHFAPTYTTMGFDLRDDGKFEILCGDDFVSTVQVFVPEFEHMFVLGGIWGVCVEDFLRDSMLHRLFVDSAWLLHHARTTCGHRSEKHRRPCFLVISHSHRLQSGCAPICSKKYKDLLARKISFQNGNYCNCLLAVFTREKSQCLKDEWMCGFCFAFTEAAQCWRRPSQEDIKMNGPLTLKIKLKLVAAEGEIRVSAPRFAVRRTFRKGSFLGMREL